MFFRDDGEREPIGRERQREHVPRSGRIGLRRCGGHKEQQQDGARNAMTGAPTIITREAVIVCLFFPGFVFHEAEKHVLVINITGLCCIPFMGNNPPLLSETWYHSCAARFVCQTAQE